MLKKLMKYDFKSIFKTVTPIYIIFMGLALLNRLADFVADKANVLSIPAGFVTALYIIMIIGVPIVTFVITIIRFYNNLTKDEGYLMHTLPVKKSDLILSKLITSLVSIFVSVLIAIAGLLVGCYGLYFDSKIFDVFRKITENFDTLFIVLLFISMILSIILQQLLIYAAISFGQKHNGNRTIYSIVYGIVMYNINQVFASIAMFIPMIFDHDLFNKMNEDVPDINLLNTFMIISIIISIGMCIGYYILAKRTMEKKLNLE